MAFCSHCGGQLQPDAQFCPYCGQAVAPIAAAPVTPVMPAAGVQDYSLVLVSTGSCPRSSADDVLEDVLGYSNAESNALVRAVPTQIAQGLNMQQAQYIAQALTEYGMQVAVYNGMNAVDLGQYATGPVFNSDGTFAAGVVAALATLGAVNRIRSFTRWAHPSPLLGLFTPRYRAPAPPRHVRRPRRPAPAPAPAPSPRPMGGNRGPVGGGHAPMGGNRGPAGPSGGNRGPAGGRKGPSGGPGGGKGGPGGGRR